MNALLLMGSFSVAVMRFLLFTLLFSKWIVIYFSFKLCLHKSARATPLARQAVVRYIIRFYSHPARYRKNVLCYNGKKGELFANAEDGESGA